MSQNDLDQPAAQPVPGQPAQYREELVCDTCGQPGAFDFGDRAVCLDCYEGCGSCCPEFGKDDLWAAVE